MPCFGVVIVVSLKKSDNKQGNIKVLMISLFKLECSIFFEEISNLHKPSSFLTSFP
jgi:hypothetical protein